MKKVFVSFMVLLLLFSVAPFTQVGATSKSLPKGTLIEELPRNNQITEELIEVLDEQPEEHHHIHETRTTEKTLSSTSSEIKNIGVDLTKWLVDESRNYIYAISRDENKLLFII